MFSITLFADSNTFLNGSPFSPDIFIAIPTIIENTNNAIILSFENSFEKSFTVSNFTVLSAIVISSSSVLSVSATSSALSNVALICSPSSVFISFTKYVLANPINTATIDVKTNTSNIEPIIFPILFGCFIFDIAVVMFKNISGIIITNNRFKNKSPNGLNIVAFFFKDYSNDASNNYCN